MAGVFAASRSTGRCPVSYAIYSVKFLAFVIRAFPEIEGLYADDTTVFGKDERSILGLFRAISLYERGSGARLKKGKTKAMWLSR